jgi:hypothetical protein
MPGVATARRRVISSTGRRAFVGERRRHWRSAARWHAHRQAKRRYGARRREGGHDAHSGSAVESSQARRGRRCGVGVEVHGGALLRSGSSSVTLASFLVRLLATSSSPRSNAPAAARRRSSASPRFLRSPPFLLPYGRAALGRGKNPNVGWWRWFTASCLLVAVVAG